MQNHQASQNKSSTTANPSKSSPFFSPTGNSLESRPFFSQTGNSPESRPFFSQTGNSPESRPFVVQPKAEATTQSPQTKADESQITDSDILNSEGERSPVQAKLAIQRQEEEPETLQAKPENTSLQRQEESKSPNQTGLPDNLKAGVENLSGYSLDNVRVHYNSSKPAQLQALAYTQGTDIHVAPGQEQHLPHEAWHVVQQMQGRVKPTMQMKGEQINDDAGLEQEADAMGEKALKESVVTDPLTKSYTQRANKLIKQRNHSREKSCNNSMQMVTQRVDLQVRYSQTPNIFDHIDDAIDKGHPKRLTKDSIRAAQNRSDAAKSFFGTNAIYNHFLNRFSFPPAHQGFSWDEYPFASTQEGGTDSSLRQVPTREQNIQGGQLANIPNNRTFDVVLFDD